MKTTHFYYNPNAHCVIQNTPIPFDSRPVKSKFLDIPYATISFSQKLETYLPDEGDWPFPVIAGINRGAFFGWNKGNMHVTPMPKGIFEKALHPNSTFESNENIDKYFNSLSPF